MHRVQRSAYVAPIAPSTRQTLSVRGVAFSLGLILAGGASACTGQGIDQGGAPRLLITSGGQEIPDGGGIGFFEAAPPVSAVTAATVSLHNTGSAELEIRSLTLTSDPPGALSLGLVTLPSASAPIVVPAPVGDAPSSLQLAIMRSPVSGPPPAATLQIETNYTLALADRFVITIEAQVGPPVIVVDPAVLSFGTVGEGAEAEEPLTILNTGGSALLIDRIGLAGDDSFSVTAGGQLILVAPEAAQSGVTLDPPLVVGAGGAVNLPVGFSPDGPQGVAATVTLHANDPKHPDGIVVPLAANSEAPCISFDPEQVTFGPHLPGVPVTTAVQVMSCGGGPLVLETPAIHGDLAGAFSLALTGAQLFPVSLLPVEAIELDVTYTALEVSALDASGAPILDGAELRAGTNTWFGEVALPLSGYGVETICPTPVVLVEEGDEVVPQTVLHLRGDQSFGPEPIVGWHWEVEQPVGSASPLLPSAAAPNPVFEAHVAGLYVFSLQVTDAAGDSCGPAAKYSVLVLPDDAIHVELLWDTAGDLDQSDEGPEAGADLDLHFAHPFAAHADLDDDGLIDPWFDIPFDCFWFNSKPNWGVFAPAISDDARLDRDDTDGAGPENVNLAEPEDDVTYRIGVHYWNDHGFGPSDATLRVYIYQQLVLELVLEDMVVGDLWDAATIAWPSGQVSLVVDAAGGFDVTPNLFMADFMGY